MTYKPIDTPWNTPFANVPEGDWYYEAVQSAQERGLMNGHSDGRSGPSDTLSRAQLAQILFNKELHFNDTDEISVFALETLRWAVENGILNGYRRLDPQWQTARAQAVQILKNFIEGQEETA